MPKPVTVATRIRVALLEAEKRQGDIAIALKLSEASISDRMRGKIGWRLDELVTIARLLDVPLSRLIQDEAGQVAS